jgi:predicted transcriptional regulator
MTEYSLGPLEQDVMRCIWEHEKKSVREVHECLNHNRKIAYTTVMTIMKRLVDKDMLKRKRAGNAYMYSAKNSKEHTAKSIVGKIFSSLVDQFGEEAIVAFSDEVDKASSTRK